MTKCNAKTLLIVTNPQIITTNSAVPSAIQNILASFHLFWFDSLQLHCYGLVSALSST